jgi:hypothetical protein
MSDKKKLPLPVPITRSEEIDAESPGTDRNGWLVLRIKPREGFTVDNHVEVRLTTVNNQPIGQVKIAIKAPRSIRIRRVK